MFFSILIILALFGVGIWYLVSAISSRRKSKLAQEWPVARGVILVSEVVEDRMRSATGKASISYIPEIRYEYNAAGEKLTGKRVVFGTSSYAYITASEICAHFPVGGHVDVYYNPANPSDSVLVPKSKDGERSFVPGIFFVLTGIAVVIVMIAFN